MMTVNSLTDARARHVLQAFFVYSVAFFFGLLVSVGGLIGLTTGSALSYKLRDRIPWVDPVICGCGLLISTPFIFPAIGFAKNGIIVCFILTFFAQIFVNMNWAVIVDISLVRRCRLTIAAR